MSIYLPRRNGKGYLETDRLYMTDYNSACRSALFRNIRSEELASALGIKRVTSLEKATEYYLEAKRTSKSKTARNARYAICLKENNKFVGNVSLYATENRNEVEIGYWVDAELRNKGYMSELLPKLVTTLIENGFNIYIRALKNSESSNRVCEKAALVYYGSDIDMTKNGGRGLEYNIYKNKHNMED